eukprot:4291503-Prymnesium_polylepis.1
MLHRVLTRRSPAVLGRATRAFSTQMMEPVTTLMEEETMMRDAAHRFATEEVAPRSRAMDDAGAFDPALIQGLFDAGFMGVEIGEEYGGVGSSFTSALLVIEELARADPAVSVMCDIHNTIVNNCISMWASDRIKS